jgi:hypothetical protein
MIETPKNNKVEMHGCIVCARTFTILAVYAQDGRLLDCAVTSPGGHCLPGELQPLAACDTHTGDEIEAAYKKWKSIRGEENKRYEVESD